uniref:Immunoglobulin V-set domain-containing protein n=1 Tax=Pundamilia nyererei TaxID=303518 RepID=A0A3B4F931_9CICH
RQATADSSEYPDLLNLLYRCCDTVTKILNYQGYSESISCPYERQYQNSLKYICRGNRPSTCLQQALITSDNKENGRFRLDDDKMLKKFTVNITSLSQEDSGYYLCGCCCLKQEGSGFKSTILLVCSWFPLGILVSSHS